MSKQNGYIGRSPGDSAVIIASQTFEPTGIQTDFTFASGYTVGYLDVYFNGARLIYANDYTASDGSTVGLTTYANNGDVLELVAYKAFNVGDVTEAKNNFTVGNKLTVSGVTTATSAYYTGSVTASSFSGDGSGLTGVASTDNIITGVAVTVGGILRVTDTTQSTSATTGSVIISGGVGIAKSLTVDGNVTIGGTLTYEDMTNTDNLGFGTFRKGIEVQGAGSTTTTLNVTGIATIGVGLTLADNVRAKFGNAGDYAIYHDGTESWIKNDTGTLNILNDNIFQIKSLDDSKTAAQFNAAGEVSLRYNDSVKFRTISSGVSFPEVVDIAGDLQVAGITTVGILTAYDSLTVSVWTLGASGTNHYTFTGPGDLSADTDPDLQLIRGQRYIFENRSGGHPFRIQSTVNGSAGTAYNDGVTNNDAADGTDLVFDVPFDAPPILYYQCTSHNNMGGAIYVGSSSGDNVTVVGVLTATEFVGGGSGLTGLNIPSSFTELDAMLFN